MTKRIHAKVAKILNSREIVISAGQDKGVRVGMYFDVLDEEGEEIQDPDTGEVLGSLERKKVRLKVTDVREKLSIASTYKSTKVNVGGSADSVYAQIGPIAKALMPPKWVTKYQTIKSDEAPWDELDEESSFVKTGDPVVQVLERVDSTEIDDFI
tara:strand:+ start:605 stop:1069 length:465 start_codon:yes stop_codon:yes gene_type:complete